jgi:hypothetical protein
MIVHRIQHIKRIVDSAKPYFNNRKLLLKTSESKQMSPNYFPFKTQRTFNQKRSLSYLVQYIFAVEILNCIRDLPAVTANDQEEGYKEKIYIEIDSGLDGGIF